MTQQIDIRVVAFSFSSIPVLVHSILFVVEPDFASVEVH